ncbi:MAG TPA: hypothetical protein VMH23_11505 [Bacteroidota bacterium]|nr:hypothetical protein [Bacteroidota bacterium]
MLTSKERKYLEMLILNDALIDSDIIPLDDGDAYSSDYVGGSTKLNDRGYPLRWGRIIHRMKKSVGLEEVSTDCVVATVTRTIEGIMKISAPYQLSTRMRHSFVSKPFTENSIRKARFMRIGETGYPARNWKLNGVSIVHGGTEMANVSISEFELRTQSGDTISLRSPDEPTWPFRVNGHGHFATVGGETDLDVRVKVQTSEIEPNMVVLRSGYRGKWGQRTLLPLKIENRVGDRYIHTYENTVRAQPRPGVFHAVVEAISRESLCDMEAPVHTRFWGIPYTVQ